MFIVIVGGGKIGYYLVKSLLHAGHEVAVVEKNQERAKQISDDLSAIAIRGDGCDPRVLEEAGIGRAEVMVADTGDDEDNLVICQVAKLRFNVPHTIARVNNPRNETIFRKLGIDATVSSTDVVLSVIEHEVAHRGIMPIVSFRKSGLEMIETTLTAKSPLIGKTLKEVCLPNQCRILVVLRDDQILNVDDSTKLQANDSIFSLVTPKAFEEVKKQLIGSTGA